MGFNKFTSIESFSHVFRKQQFFDEKAVVKYGAKIKLHGTNAAVRVDVDGVHAQSRSRDITPQNDNVGFAAWVEKSASAWQKARPELVAQITFFGEWAGNGIQKKDAVTQLNQKYFFIFAVQMDDEMVVDPERIEEHIPDLDDVLVLPWDKVFEKEVDFGDPDACQAFTDTINEAVQQIGERDPFIYGIFGVDAPGEGLVISPVCNPGSDPIEGTLDQYWYNVLTFKAKTKAHRVQKTKKAASKDVEIPAGVVEFVETFVTEARCDQVLSEACSGEAIPENTGRFLKMIGQDIKKESVPELAGAGLEWKDVSKSVTQAARKWFQHRTSQITDNHTTRTAADVRSGDSVEIPESHIEHGLGSPNGCQQ